MESLASLVRYGTMSASAGVGLYAASASSANYLVPGRSFCGGECSELTFRPEAFLAGVPVAFFGLVYWSVASALVFSICCRPSQGLLGCLRGVSVVGLLVSALLVARLVFAIGIYCSNCALSAASASVLAVAVWVPAAESAASKLFSVISLMCICASVALIGVQVRQSVSARDSYLLELDSRLTPKAAAALRRSAHIFGSERSKMDVIFFGSPGCPECQGRLRQLLQRVSNGENIRIVLHSFTLPNSLEERAIWLASSEHDQQRFLADWTSYYELARSNTSLARSRLANKLRSVDPSTLRASQAECSADRALAVSVKITRFPTIFVAERDTVKAVPDVPFQGFAR